jgi:lysozyme family protein
VTDRFDVCIPFTLIEECPLPNDWNNPRNYSDDVGDSGGPTMCGITHVEYDLWRKSHGLPVQDVRKMTHDEGFAIYKNSYWLPYCPNLPIGLDLQFFDSAVNMGSGRAVKLLQASLGVGVDGDWGPKTTAAVTLITPATLPGIIKDETNQRAATYRSFGGYARFGKDWIGRDYRIGKEALTMAGSKGATA